MVRLGFKFDVLLCNTYFHSPVLSSQAPARLVAAQQRPIWDDPALYSRPSNLAGRQRHALPFPVVKKKRRCLMYKCPSTESHNNYVLWSTQLPAALLYPGMATADIEYQPAQNHVVGPTSFLQPRRIQNGGRSQADYSLETTLLALTDTARDLPAEKVLCEEIQSLCRAALTIDQAFNEIGQKLAEATKTQHNHVQLQVAGEAQSAVDDFCQVFLPWLRDPAMTLSERQQLIQDQIKESEDKANTSQGLTQAFLVLNLGTTLDTFIADFSRVVEGLGRGEQTEKTRVLESRLRPAKAAMDAVSEEVKELGWKFAGDVIVTGISVLLAVVAPIWWEKLAASVAFGIKGYSAKNSGFQLLEALRRRGVMNYKALKNEYDLEQACLSQMVKLESTLHDARPVVHDVTSKLGAFASVWAAITADLRAIRNSLEYATDPTSQLFARRVQRLERLYGCLSQALRYYQVTVRLPEVA
ncbi:hypothetical protein BU15DRAFT_66105 [Melanogaster broomeanus]|nr:hypothetical protein BU15DRAFT_66105 [Melanogaster broomeanus]